MNQNSELTREIRNYCKKIGVDIVGFADPGLFDRFPKFHKPEYFLKDAKTVIVIGMHIYDIVLDAWFEDSKRSFHFADTILENFCYKIKNFISEQGYISKIISYTPGFFLKDAAALAGIGPVGKNNLLITEKFGPQVRLRALTTTAPLKYGTPILESKYCENCSKCIEACPVQALNGEKYNREACYSYQISHKKKLSKTAKIWCNICIEACPVGKK